MAFDSSSFSFSFYQNFDDDPRNLTLTGSPPCMLNFTLHLDHVHRSPDPPHHVDRILGTYTSDSIAYSPEDFLYNSAHAYYILNDMWLPFEEVENVVPRLLTFVQGLVNDSRNINRHVISVMVHGEVTRIPDNSDLEGAIMSEEGNWKFENFEVQGNLELAEHECMICLEKLSDGDDKMAARLPCGHVYDSECILRWLNTSNTCPLCRYVVPEQEELSDIDL